MTQHRSTKSYIVQELKAIYDPKPLKKGVQWSPIHIFKKMYYMVAKTDRNMQAFVNCSLTQNAYVYYIWPQHEKH